MFTRANDPRVESVEMYSGESSGLGILRPNYLLKGKESFKGETPDLTIVAEPPLKDLVNFDAILVFNLDVADLDLLESIKRSAKPSAKLYVVNIADVENVKNGRLTSRREAASTLASFTVFKWRSARGILRVIPLSRTDGRKDYQKLLKVLLADLNIKGTEVEKMYPLLQWPSYSAYSENICHHLKAQAKDQHETLGHGFPKRDLGLFSLWVERHYPETNPEVLATLWDDGSITNLYTLLRTLESIQGI